MKGDRRSFPRLGQPRQQPLAALGAAGQQGGAQVGISLPASPGLGSTCQHPSLSPCHPSPFFFFFFFFFAFRATPTAYGISQARG